MSRLPAKRSPLMLRLLSSVAIVSIGALPLPSHAIAIGFETATSTVDVGDTFNVDIVVSDLLAAGETVSAFDVFIGFDPTIAAATSAMLGPGPTDTFTTDTLSSFGTGFDLGPAFLGALGFGTGTMEITGLGLFPPLPGAQGDSVLLGTLTFQALAADTTTFSLFHPLYGFPDVKGVDPATPLSFADIGSLDISVAPPVPVPEPGTLGLLSLGLLLAWVGRRRSREKT